MKSLLIEPSHTTMLAKTIDGHFAAKWKWGIRHLVIEIVYVQANIVEGINCSRRVNYRASLRLKIPCANKTAAEWPGGGSVVQNIISNNYIITQS